MHASNWACVVFRDTAQTFIEEQVRAEALDLLKAWTMPPRWPLRYKLAQSPDTMRNRRVVERADIPERQ